MNMAGLFFTLVLTVTSTGAQSIKGFGSSGGCGPTGGIGDKDHPVLFPQSFITDGDIQSDHPDLKLRQLSPGLPPLLLPRIQTAATCNFQRTVVIDDKNGAQQEMVGFGHAWTDSTVEVFNSLEPQVFDQVMRDLFGQEGNNMGFMRHSIGSSDMSGNQYSFDDNGPSFNEGEVDSKLKNFDLGVDGKAMVQMIAKMGDYKSDIFLFGSPWSYPGWMKYNGLFVAPNVGFQPLNNSFDPLYVNQAVGYLTKYVDAYKSYNVTVNGITLANEPLNYQGGYPCMFLDPNDAASIISKGLGKAMQERGVKIMAYDHNTDQPTYPTRVLQQAGKRVEAAAWHCYASSVNYSTFADFHQSFPSTPQFMTECSSYLPSNVSLYMAQNFMGPVQNGASGAAFWVLATDPDYGPHSPYGGCAGCLGSIVVNSSTEYTKTHDYYMMGQFSRFIRRGSTNYKVLQGIKDSSSGTQFLVISVKNPDDSWAVVFLNNIGEDQEVQLSFKEGNSDFAWTGIIPDNSVVTWLLPSHGTVANNSTLFPDPNAILPSTNCPAPTPTPSSSSAATMSTPLIPVPNTNHTLSIPNLIISIGLPTHG